MKYLKVWTNFRQVVSSLNDDEIGRLFLAMLWYAEAGEEPDNLIGNEQFIWPAAKRDIDMAAQFAETKRNNGKKGGRPKTKDNQDEPNETKDNQDEPNKSLKEKKRKEMKINENESSKNIVPLKRFIPPTVDEVQAYCDQRSSWLIDPQAFIDYYEVRGWMLNKNRKMVDWKAAVRTWEHNERERQEKERHQYEDLPY